MDSSDTLVSWTEKYKSILNGWNTGLFSSKPPFTAMANVHILFLRHVTNIDV